MVFGNLATGYWLFKEVSGGGSGTAPFWVELGRKTLTGTSDTIDVAGHNWVEYAGDIDIDTGNTNLSFHIESGTNGAKGYIDLTSVSDTQWVLRFEKVNFSTINTYGEMWLGLSSITSANGANSGSMVAARPSDYGDSDDYLAVQSFNSSTTEVTGNEVRPDYSTGVDYDIEIKRTSATAVEAKLYTDNFGTLVGTSSSTISGTTGLRYLFVGSRHNTGAGNTNTNFAGTIESVKFWNDTNDISGTPTLSESFSGLTAKPYMMVLGHQFGADTHVRYRFNNDTGSNYARRYSANGGSDSTNVNQDNFPTNYDMNPCFNILNIMNIADQEKLIEGGTCELNQTTGAGTAPNRMELTGKWTNTSNAINQVNCYQTGSGDFAVGSEVVVLGYDPDDTEGTSVWEELASNDESSGTNTSTFTAKKYLWVQFKVENSGSIQPELILGSGGSIDTGNNFSTRVYSADIGSSDVTRTSQDSIETERASTAPIFMNFFIINKSDKEKLCIGEAISQESAGAGNAPVRWEIVGKWANTSAQANILGFKDSGSGSFATSSLKVWGFD